MKEIKFNLWGTYQIEYSVEITSSLINELNEVLRHDIELEEGEKIEDFLIDEESLERIFNSSYFERNDEENYIRELLCRYLHGEGSANFDLSDSYEEESDYTFSVE